MRRFITTCMLSATLLVAAASCGNGDNKDGSADSLVTDSLVTPPAVDTPSTTVGGQNLDSIHFGDTTHIPAVRDSVKH